MMAVDTNAAPFKVMIVFVKCLSVSIVVRVG